MKRKRKNKNAIHRKWPKVKVPNNSKLQNSIR